MRKITIELFDDQCKITEETEVGAEYSFGKTVMERSKMFLALAKHLGINLQEITSGQPVCQEDCSDLDFDDEDLEDAVKNSRVEELCNIWLNELLESTGKSSPEYLTASEILADMKDAQRTLKDEGASDNVKALKCYIDMLEGLLLTGCDEAYVESIRWKGLPNLSNETIKIWLNDLLEETEKVHLKELTPKEIQAEIKEAEDSINNFSVWGDAHAIADCEEYIEVLKELLNTSGSAER